MQSWPSFYTHDTSIATRNPPVSQVNLMGSAGFRIFPFAHILYIGAGCGSGSRGRNPEEARGLLEELYRNI